MAVNFTDNNSKRWDARRSTEKLFHGRQFEAVAVEYCKLLGYSVCALNFRLGHLEADILAEQNGINILVEVRGKNSKSFLPSRMLTPKKQRNLRIISQVLARKSKKPIRIELLEILRVPKGQENFSNEQKYYRINRFVLEGPGT